MEFVWTLKPIYFDRLTTREYDWVDIGDRNKAIELHENGDALAACRLEEIEAELETTTSPQRIQLLQRFLFAYYFGMPLEAAKYYGTQTVRELYEISSIAKDANRQNNLPARGLG